MSELAKNLLFLVATSLVFCVGVVNLVSPKAYDVFVDWYSRVGRISMPRPLYRRGLEIGRRLAGLVLAYAGLRGTYIEFQNLAGHRPPVKIYETPPPPVKPSGPLATVVGAVVVAVGVYMMLRPGFVALLVTQAFPHRQFHAQSSAPHTRGGRILGAAFILMGLAIIALSLDLLRL